MLATRTANDITPIVPGALYRVGTTVAIDHLSWVDRSTTGFDPLNCYLLRDDDVAVFVDVGAAIAEQQVRDAIATLVAGRRTYVYPTRNEAECIGNLGLVLGTTKDPHLLWGSGGGILEWVNDPSVSLLESRNFIDRIPIQLTPNGTNLRIGTAAHLHFFDAVVKCMFLTQWAYEERTKTLFSSDFFGWQHLATQDGDVILDRGEDAPTVEFVAAEIAARVNFLPGGRAPGLANDLRRVFETYDIEVIAPDHGRVLRGKDVIGANLDLAIAALQVLTGGNA